MIFLSIQCIFTLVSLRYSLSIQFYKIYIQIILHTTGAQESEYLGEVVNPISWIRGVAGGSLKIISLPHQIISIFKIKSLSLKPLLGCASISRNFTCQFKVKSLQLHTQYQQYFCISKFATNIVQSPIIFIELINSIFS